MIFQKNRNCYGYRRIYEELKKIGITVSEKIVRRIMKEENLTVPTKHIKKYIKRLKTTKHIRLL